MNDHDMLKKIGLSEQELRDLLAKFDQFVRTLNPAQQRALKKGHIGTDDAAATLTGDVTAQRLEQFIRARAPESGTLMTFRMAE